MSHLRYCHSWRVLRGMRQDYRGVAIVEFDKRSNIDFGGRIEFYEDFMRMGVCSNAKMRELIHRNNRRTLVVTRRQVDATELVLF